MNGREELLARKLWVNGMPEGNVKRLLHKVKHESIRQWSTRVYKCKSSLGGYGGVQLVQEPRR